MNFIKDIQIAEEEAAKKISDAEKAVSDAVSAAQKKKENKIISLSESMKEDHDKKMKDQRPKLTDIYKRIIADGEEEARRIRSRSESSLDKISDLIVEKITSKI